MEKLISHFKYYSNDYYVLPGLAFSPIETPKGIFWVFLISDGSNKPYVVKSRSPVAHNMHLIEPLNKGAMFGDFVATFCSLDIVMGELDR